MPGSQIAKAFEVNPSILAFRPRQVALLPKPPIMELDNAKTLVLKPEQKALLFHSIAQFLERSGFSKTVKKFMSEAKIQKDDLGDSSYNLEEIFCKFLDICNDSKNSKSHKVKDGGVDDTSAIDMPVDGERKSDKASKSENVANVVDVKSKEKKKNKKDTDTIDQEQVSTKVLEETGNGANDDSKEEKKKKKKTKKSSHPVIDEEKPNKNEIQSSKEHEIETENKSSKKRKRLDVVQPACENVVEESKNKKKEKSKRRKTEGSEDPKVEEVSKELKSTTESEEKAQKEEINQACLGESQVNGLLNGSLGKSGEKSSIKKTMKKEQNGSAEPKSVKHFQRVKVDEVVFSDERLKNNSYWAKDGAEIGYGAKAQEILEQVRGRDFRHEKTKKKRGSYRGGQIDLQSHSVKFNYSDGE